jgi:hypothetical protein
MPIRAEEKARYPEEWPLISLWVRVCAGWRCEWCPAVQGEPHPVTGSRVVLTVAHLDHTPENVTPVNLRASASGATSDTTKNTISGPVAER